MARFPRVNPGDSVQLKATEWNAMLEAAEAEINRRANQPGQPLRSSLPAGCVWAVNTSGGDLFAGDVVVSSGFAAAPPDLISTPLLHVAIPRPADTRYIAAAIENAPAGSVFRLRLQGPALVRLTQRPKTGEIYLAIDDSGKAAPAEFGQARIVTSSSGENVIALVILGCGVPGEPSDKGMFQLIDVSARSGSPTVRICDGAMPSGGIAGIANINNQSYSCRIREFAVNAEPQYFYFKFTAPTQRVNSAEPGAPGADLSACELVAFSDESEVVSTDTVVYRLIGHAWTESPEPEPGDDETPRPRVKLVQDHPVGNLIINWFGPCLDLLDGVIDE